MCSVEEPPAVWGVERVDGDGRNWRSPPWPWTRDLGAVGAYNRKTGKSYRAERVAEGAVGAMDRYGQQNLPGAKGPCFVRVWVDEEESVHGQSRAQ